MMRDPAKTLEAVYETDHRKLVNAARVLVGFDAATELVQDAFARCVPAWRGGVPDDPHAYVRVVVLNLARSSVRRAIYRRSVRFSAPNPDRQPDEHYLATALQRRLIDELGALPRRQRECVALRYLLDQSVAETATALGISEGSVKTHTHRALATLAQRMVDER